MEGSSESALCTEILFCSKRPFKIQLFQTQRYYEMKSKKKILKFTSIQTLTSDKNSNISKDIEVSGKTMESNIFTMLLPFKKDCLLVAMCSGAENLSLSFLSMNQGMDNWGLVFRDRGILIFLSLFQLGITIVWECNCSKPYAVFPC